jgi:hypothetical protein
MRCLGLEGGPDMDPLPYTRYVRDNLPWFRPADAAGQRAMAVRLAEEVCDAARHARHVAALRLQAAEDREVTVFCTAEEEAQCLAALLRLHPGWRWRGLGLSALDAGRPKPPAGAAHIAQLARWLDEQRVAVLAPGCAKEFRYVLSLLPDDKLIGLDELLEALPLV